MLFLSAVDAALKFEVVYLKHSHMHVVLKDKIFNMSFNFTYTFVNVIINF